MPRRRVSKEIFGRARNCVETLDPHLGRATDLLLDLLALPGVSGQEQEVSDYVSRRLLQSGAAANALKTDQAHRRTRIDGEAGNLVFRMGGKVRSVRRMLVAHMDTVPICRGSQPEIRKNKIVSRDPDTGLGADDRAGVAVLLSTALELLENKIPCPPLTFLWTVQEEIGLQGARHAALGMLGKPQLAFNFDGGSPEKLTIGATGGYRMQI
ncbi:MAG: M20/M25/M40 family metallo-hydrolase, partial [Pirellulales bacterium]|nr:M20/M25/M40 family metallo-hydrolase [Pirellulales bacterium]